MRIFNWFVALFPLALLAAVLLFWAEPQYFPERVVTFVWLVGYNVSNLEVFPYIEFLTVSWVTLFSCLLLSASLIPNLWRRYLLVMSLLWLILFAVPCVFLFWYGMTLQIALQAFLICSVAVLPFLVIFLLAGNISITGTLTGTPKLNSLILALGSLLAAITDAGVAILVFYRLLLRANGHRQYVLHSVVFFLFITGVVSGALRPLPPPPPHLGFLNGLFSYERLIYLVCQMLFTQVTLLAVYFSIDCLLFRRESLSVLFNETSKSAKKIAINGQNSLLLLLLVFALTGWLFAGRISFLPLGFF